MRRAIGLAIFALCGQAQAVLQDVAGANYSFDTGTSLYWLDPVATLGFSPTQALASNEGWRYATTHELAGLFEASAPFTRTQADSFAASMGGYTAYLGSIPGGNYLEGIWHAPEGYVWGGLAVINVPDKNDFGFYPSLGGGNPIGATEGITFEGPPIFGGVGSFLVSSTVIAPVPEPGTYAMMAMGLGVIGWVARRRRGG
jgi:hypothetical protein